MTRSSLEREQHAAALRVFEEAHACYFLQHGAGGLIKIGHTVDITQRIRGIQVNCPLPLVLLGWRSGGFREEKRMHRRFEDARAWGEWFRPTAALIEFCAVELEHTRFMRPVPPSAPWEERAPAARPGSQGVTLLRQAR